MSNHIGQRPGEQMLAEAPASDPRSPREPVVNGEIHERVELTMLVRRSLRLLILILGLGLASNGVAAATTAANPSDFISGLVNAAFSALANKQLTENDRAKDFHAILDKDFDMPLISRFVLGRYWKEATDPERQRFVTLFEEYVIRCYAKPFSEYYSGETVRVIGARPVGETTTLVQSEVIGTDGGPPTKLDWLVRKDDDGYKIVDVDVEGVSLVLTQREQFGSVIERAGGVAHLNRELEQKFASGDTTAGQL
jgi:phospholipid transport system substrate-binding protein